MNLLLMYAVFFDTEMDIYYYYHKVNQKIRMMKTITKKKMEGDLQNEQ